MKVNGISERSTPLLFLLVTILAYGLLVPLTGFYWDDWPFAWIAKFLGPQEFTPAFAGVRPFLGPIFFITTSLIPPVPIYWQICAILVRFIAALAAWFALTQVWPRQVRQVLFTSLLFLVFPGYSQHWVAFTHINQEWIPFIFYLLSFGFTARALREASIVSGEEAVPEDRAIKQHPNPLKYTVYALLLLIAGVFPTEYFVSIEPLRFLFIWVMLSEPVRGLGHRVVETLKRWWPYLLVWLANAAWLAYFYTLGGYASYDVEVVSEPLTLAHVISTLTETIWKVGFYIWVQILFLAANTITAPTTLATLALIAVTFLFVLYELGKRNLTGTRANTFALPAILIGLSGIILGRVPSFAAGLPLTLQSSFDRFMISMMLGGSLFVVGSIELLIQNHRIKIYTLALLIALGTGQQFFNANIFRRDWTKQQEIYSQLAWRIPALKPGTALLTHQLPIDYETDLSFTAPINWMYAPAYRRSDPGDQSGNLPYALLYTEKRLGGSALPSLDRDVQISLPIRRVSFHGSTSQAIVIYMPSNGCLRVLDPGRGDQITYSQQSRFLVDAIPLSDLSNILTDHGETAKISFLPEPEHTWCYYFEKAELARQQGDWNRILELIDEARSLGYQPEDPFEWLAYIEAQARRGHVQAAIKTTEQAYQQETKLRKGLCELWRRVQSASSAGDEEVSRLNQVLSDLQCLAPN